MGPSDRTVLILSLCLLGLVLLLILLYKKLNKEADGEYTIRRMVYKKGGLRDRMRGAVSVVGTRLGVQLWPPSDEDGEEMEQIRQEERQVEEGGSQGGDSEVGDQEEEDDDEEQAGMTKGREDSTAHNTSADTSSIEASESKEQSRLTDQPESNEKMEGKEVNVGEGGNKGAAGGGSGLLIDLKQFSGSAIWSEEEGGEGKERDVTAL